MCLSTSTACGSHFLRSGSRGKKLSRIDPDPWGDPLGSGGLEKNRGEGEGGFGLVWHLWGIHRVLKKPRTENIRRYSPQKKDFYMLKIRDTKVEYELEFNPSWTSRKLS